MFVKTAILHALTSVAYAGTHPPSPIPLQANSPSGTILWDGRFNDFTSSSDLNKWSWANQVGPYQYYIHGSGPVTSYVNLSPSYKNPGDVNSKQGAKITIDSTAKWNSDMWRTELIPQTKAAINSGTVYYHFSMKRSSTNVPSATNEHQICFFESHFTEMKYGWISGEQGTSNTNLQWFVGGQSKWKVDLKADEWHNVVYEIVSHHREQSEPVSWFLLRSANEVRTSAPSRSPSGTRRATTRSSRPRVRSQRARRVMARIGIWECSGCPDKVTMGRALRIGISRACMWRVGRSRLRWSVRSERHQTVWVWQYGLRGGEGPCGRVTAARLRTYLPFDL